MKCSMARFWRDLIVNVRKSLHATALQLLKFHLCKRGQVSDLFSFFSAAMSSSSGSVVTTETLSSTSRQKTRLILRGQSESEADMEFWREDRDLRLKTLDKEIEEAFAGMHVFCFNLSAVLLEFFYQTFN